jgi:aminoglycoside phosphotransferase
LVVSDAGRIDGEVIACLLSQRVTGYELLAGFAANTVAAVTLASGARVVFKAAAAREVEVELWALRSMAARGVPVPEVVAGAPDAEIPYLVTRLLAGEPGVATRKAASDVGRLLRAIGNIPPDPRDVGVQRPSRAVRSTRPVSVAATRRRWSAGTA